MPIELPEYQRLFENQVYTRNQSLLSTDGKPFDLTHILMPRRYTAASEEEVITLLAQKADELEGAARLIVPNSAAERRKPLEALILALPEQVRMHLRTKHPDLIKFIRQNTPALSLHSAVVLPQYLSVSYGIISTDFLAQRQAEITSASAYWAVLQHPQIKQAGQGEQWQMSLLLNDGLLPLKPEIEVLILHGVSVSDTFGISRRFYDKQQVQEAVDTLYAGLAFPGAGAHFTDISIEVLENAAIPPLVALHEYLKLQQQGAGKV